MRENGHHEGETPIHSIDRIPRSCWTCVYWIGSDASLHLCQRHPGQIVYGNDPCKSYVLWDEWLFVEWLYPEKKKQKLSL